MLRPGQAVALCVLALLVIGVVMVNSAGMTVEGHQTLNVQSILLSRSTMYAGLAMLALFVCALLPIRRLLPTSVRGEETLAPADEPDALRSTMFTPGWFSELFREYLRMWPLWLGAFTLVVTLALVYAPGVSRPRNGSHRWINLRLPGFESMQPSEIAKWGLIILMAWFGARYAKRMKSFWLGFLPGLAAAGMVSAFIVLEDLGTGALLGVAACIVLVAAGGRLWQLAILLPVPIAGAILAIVTSEYRMNRIMAFMNPYLDPKGKGFHMIQSMVAVANGEVFGRGLGGGLQKFEYLPEDTTDFIFAIICEELGIAGAAVVLFLFAGLLWGVWTITRRERIPMLKLIGLGVMATIGIQALINLAVVTGLGPTKGIALPLLSSGGTGWILTAAALGLVIAMDRAQAFETFATLAGNGGDGPLTDGPGFGGPGPGNDGDGPLTNGPGFRGATPELALAMASSPEFAELKPAHVEDQPPRGQIFNAAPPAATHVARTPAPAPIPVAPGETGLLFAMHTPPAPAAPAALPASVASSVTGIDSTITEPSQVSTHLDTTADDAPIEAGQPAAPQVVITDEARDWPRTSSRLGMA